MSVFTGFDQFSSKILGFALNICEFFFFVPFLGFPILSGTRKKRNKKRVLGVHSLEFHFWCVGYLGVLLIFGLDSNFSAVDIYFGYVNFYTSVDHSYLIS